MSVPKVPNSTPIEIVPVRRRMVSYVSIFFNTSCNHFCKFLLTRWTGEKQSTVKTSERRRPENYRCHSEDNEEEGKSSTGST